MAPKVQPKRLYRLSLARVSSLVDQACNDVFLNHGCYGTGRCMKAIATLQDHLALQLPLTVFEHLAEERNSRVLHTSSQLLWTKDSRIKLSVFLHPSLTRFAVDAKGNELMQAQDAADGLDEFFWCTHIKRLSNLVSLNLNLITTDQILVLVGASCPLLETVNIVSRIRQDVSHESPHYLSSAAGITLRFCVSDFGLRAMLKCKRLRRITMNKIINQGSAASQSITLEGIRVLVRDLPRLQYINFGSVGKILAGEDFDEEDRGAETSEKAGPLRLTYFSELDPTFVDVPRLQRLCPHIQHISLAVPINFNGSSFVSANVGPCNQVLQELADSSLPLRVIELQHFPYGEPFKNLLRSKGAHVEELLFRANGQLNSAHVRFIGEHCPRLQRLHLKELGPEEGPTLFGRSVQLSPPTPPDGASSGTSSSSPTTTSAPLFPALTTVHLSGRMWNPNAVLPLLLSSSGGSLSTLSLLNMSYRPTMDAAFSRLLESGCLRRLSCLSLYSGCFLSLPLIRRLALSGDCPCLSAISFLQCESIEISDVEGLRAEAAGRNLDLKLCCLELYVD